jgi:hypothetical protein
MSQNGENLSGIFLSKHKGLKSEFYDDFVAINADIPLFDPQEIADRRVTEIRQNPPENYNLSESIKTQTPDFGGGTNINKIEDLKINQIFDFSDLNLHISSRQSRTYIEGIEDFRFSGNDNYGVSAEYYLGSFPFLLPYFYYDMGGSVTTIDEDKISGLKTCKFYYNKNLKLERFDNALATPNENLEIYTNVRGKYVNNPVSPSEEFRLDLFFLEENVETPGAWTLDPVDVDISDPGNPSTFFITSEQGTEPPQIDLFREENDIRDEPQSFVTNLTEFKFTEEENKAFFAVPDNFEWESDPINYDNAEGFEPTNRFFPVFNDIGRTDITANYSDGFSIKEGNELSASLHQVDIIGAKNPAMTIQEEPGASFFMPEFELYVGPKKYLQKEVGGVGIGNDYTENFPFDGNTGGTIPEVNIEPINYLKLTTSVPDENIEIQNRLPVSSLNSNGQATRFVVGANNDQNSQTVYVQGDLSDFQEGTFQGPSYEIKIEGNIWVTLDDEEDLPSVFNDPDEIKESFLGFSYSKFRIVLEGNEYFGITSDFDRPQNLDILSAWPE